MMKQKTWTLNIKTDGAPVDLNAGKGERLRWHWDDHLIFNSSADHFLSLVLYIHNIIVPLLFDTTLSLNRSFLNRFSRLFIFFGKSHAYFYATPS